MATTSSKRQATLRVIPAAALLAFVSLGGVVALWQHQTARSTIDGRYLTEFDYPTLASVADKTWMDSFDAYVDDRLPGRQTWLTLHGAVVAKVMLDPVVDDVYLRGPDGQLLEKPNHYEVPASLVTEGAALAEAAATAGSKVVWLYAPRKEEVYADAIPDVWENVYPDLHTDIVDALSQSGEVIDFTELLATRAANGDAFYRTDHHWTADAALAAVQQTVADLAEQGVDLGAGPDEYETVTAQYPFYGATGRRVTAGATDGDVFTYPVPAGGFNATMCLDTACDLATINQGTLEAPGTYTNRYASFIDGDNGFTVITNDSPDAAGRVVLLKDSYGDAYATYLAEHVAELYVIDERHYEGMALNALFASLEPDVVLVLHNQVSLLSEAFDSSVWTTTAEIEDGEQSGTDDETVARATEVYDDVVVVDGRLLLVRNPNQPLDETLTADASTLASALDQTGVPQLWVYLPRREEVFADLIPAEFPNPTFDKHDQLLEYLNAAHPIVDLTTMLSDPDNRELWYYRTDHHLTPVGASAVVDVLVEDLAAKGVQIPADTREWQTVQGPLPFLGSVALKLPSGVNVAGETFTYREPDGGFRAHICSAYNCDQPLIVESIVNDPDPFANRYRAFLGGGFRTIHLHNDSPEASGTIVMLKDSYAHAVAIELGERVTDLYLVDERGYDGKPLAQFVEDVGADAVIVMHNPVSMLSQDFNRDVWRQAGD